MDPLVVAAIDIGSAYSGWAFSFKHDYDRDPLKIKTKLWRGSSFVSPKAPTCILIKSDGKTTDSFGYEAEDKYAEICEEHEQDQWFFFKRFREQFSRDMDTLDDENGKKLPAITVVSLAIEYLKGDVLDAINRDVTTHIDVSDVQWVLTVPAIWNDAAKQFIREAAQKAGIPGKIITICLEPEAASIYCRQLPMPKNADKEGSSLAQFSSGMKYLVLDAGGCTVDITVYEVTDSGDLKELHKTSSGALGGNKVNEAYEEFLSDIVGRGVFSKFTTEYLGDYIELIRDFEGRKRQISSFDKGSVTLRLPPSLLDLCKEIRGVHLKELLLQSRFNNKVRVFSDKLRIDAEVFKAFYDPTVGNIISYVKDILTKASVNGCTALLLVGGLSQSQILQDKVRSSFPSLRVIFSYDAGLEVLKGAVLFGHKRTSAFHRHTSYRQ